MSFTQPHSFELRLTTPNGELLRTFTSEAAAGEAWREVVATPGSTTYAAVVRTTGPWSTRWRCEWSPRGTFVDRTEGHVELLRQLCDELRGAAPPGFWISLASTQDVVRMSGRGERGEHHAISVVYSSEERVRAHWAGYVPGSARAEAAMRRRAAAHPQGMAGVLADDARGAS